MKDYTQVMQNENTRWCIVDTGEDARSEASIVYAGYKTRDEARFQRNSLHDFMHRQHAQAGKAPLKRGRFRVAKMLVIEKIFIPTK